MTQQQIEGNKVIAAWYYRPDSFFVFYPQLAKFHCSFDVLGFVMNRLLINLTDNTIAYAQDNDSELATECRRHTACILNEMYDFNIDGLFMNIVNAIKFLNDQEQKK